MFKIYFAAVLIIGLQSISSEPDKLKDLVPLKDKPTTPKTKTDLAKIRPAVWDKLPDDACVFSRPSQGFERMMSLVVQVCSAFGPTASEKKTKTRQCTCQCNMLTQTGCRSMQRNSATSKRTRTCISGQRHRNPRCNDRNYLKELGGMNACKKVCMCVWSSQIAEYR